MKKSTALKKKADDLSVWNDTKKSKPQLRIQGDQRATLEKFFGVQEEFEKCDGIQQYFERQAKKTPQNIALEFETSKMTYQELDQKSNQLAHYLREQGVSRDVFVGLLMERSLEVFIAILGILKAGGAYVPLDPEYPAERISFIIDDIETPVVLTQSRFSKNISNSVKTLSLDGEWGSINDFPKSSLECINSPEDAVYMIYTSGSTGQPKGCINVHRGLANFLQWWKKTFPVKSGEKILNKTPYTFVASVPEIFRALFSGATVEIAKPQGHRDPQYLVQIIKDKSINDVQFVPSMLQAFLAEKGVENCKSLFRVISAGETLPIQVAEAFYKRLPHAQLINRYGGTEVSVAVTYWECDPKQNLEAIPIGFPISNARIYILDKSLQPVTVGTSGDLYVAGVPLSRGYWKRPELTLKNFVTDPFSNDIDAKMYKTGDQARFLTSGALEYLGREDFRIKVRGMRVEAGEIEAAILTHPQIAKAVVLSKKIHGGEDVSSLVAYLVCKGKTKNLSSKDLRSFLTSKIPDYMVPAAFIFLEALPQLSNGKVNRKALLEQKDEILESFGENYSAPVNETEKRLTSVWEEILKIKPIGRDYNYFALGGDSLNLIRIHQQLQKLNFHLSLQDLYSNPTVASQAKCSNTNETRSPEVSIPVPDLKSIVRPTEIPVTSAQAGFFFVQKMNPKSTASNVISLHGLKGDINEVWLKQIIVQNMKRHEILRTQFKQIEDRVIQVPLPPSALHFEVGTTDLSHVSLKNQKKELLKQAREIGSVPFDLEKAPLFRAHLFKLGLNNFAYLRASHHIITDFSSNRIFLDELSDMYESLKEGKSPDLPKLTSHFADYSVWEKETITKDILKPQLEYWKTKLSGAPDLLHLPVDYPRTTVQGTNFNFDFLPLPSDSWQKGKLLAQSEGVTFFQLNLAIFSLFLHRYSGDEDLCVASSIDFRLKRGLSHMIGPMINYFALRSQYSPEMSFHDFCLQTAKTANEAYDNSDVSIDKIINLIGVKRNSSYSPLYQVMFDVLLKETTPDNRKLQFSRMEVASGTGNLDLSVRITEDEDDLNVWFKYNADLFSPATIQRMLNSFINFYGKIVTKPTENIFKYPLLSEQEQVKLLDTLSGATAKFETCNGVQEYFERQVDKTPNAIALEFDSATLTYSELDGRANQLAMCLREAGVKPDVFVGLFMDRSQDMFVAILGVLKAGGAYVPLDPAYPKDRLEFLFEDIEAPLIITQRHLSNKLPLENSKKPQKILFIDDQWDTEVKKFSNVRPNVPNTLKDAAYMIYTSGSTGKPKGCPNTHENIGNYLQFVKTKHPMSSTDKLLFRTPYTFDVSVPEILYPLLCGARVVIAAPEKHGDTSYLLKLIQEKSITEVGFVPSILQLFLEEEGIKKCTSLKVVTAIGEALPFEVVKKFYECLPNAKLINSYGPTEAAVAVTYWECEPNSGGLASVPIGFAIPNTKIYILSESGHPCPIGVLGEIFIGGIQVARGYWKRPDLTDVRFVKDTFSRNPKAKMYKTGDRARFLPNGAIEYQGRMDFQVKVRGFRIELGEIESTLLEHSSIKQAAVIVKKLHGDQGAGSIIAYLIAKEAGKINTSEIKDFLKGKLPEYMVPAGFFELESLPQITSGKVDRKALMAREDQIVREGGDQYAAPIDEIEKQIAKVWEAVLHTSPIGRNDNFFSLGGDSLVLIRILHRFTENNLHFKLEDLYNHQTVAALAELLKTQKSTGPTQDEAMPPITSVAKLTEGGGKFPLSLGQEMIFGELNVNREASAISQVNSFCGPLNVQALKESIKDMLERHWSLKTKFAIDGKTPIQVIAEPEVEFFSEKDLREIPEEKLEETALEELTNFLSLGMKLDKSPAIRCHLIRVADEQYWFVLKVNHLVYDGISIPIFRNDLKELYSSKVQKRQSSLSPLQVQYVDFALWQRKFGNGNLIEKKLKYWKDTLAECTALLIPADPTIPSSEQADDESERVTRVIETPLLTKLKAFAKQQNSTLYLTLLSTLSTLLHRLSGQDDIVFSTTYSLRSPEIENLMGYFTNVLPIRINFSKRPSFVELLKQAREQSSGAQGNLVTTIQLHQSLSDHESKGLMGTPVLFNYVAGDKDPFELAGVESEYIEMESTSNNSGGFFLQIQVTEQQLNYFLLYDKTLYSKETANAIADQYDELLENLVKGD